MASIPVMIFLFSTEVEEEEELVAASCVEGASLTFSPHSGQKDDPWGNLFPHFGQNSYIIRNSIGLYPREDKKK